MQSSNFISQVQPNLPSGVQAKSLTATDPTKTTTAASTTAGVTTTTQNPAEYMLGNLKRCRFVKTRSVCHGYAYNEEEAEGEPAEPLEPGEMQEEALVCSWNPQTQKCTTAVLQNGEVEPVEQEFEPLEPGEAPEGGAFPPTSGGAGVNPMLDGLEEICPTLTQQVPCTSQGCTWYLGRCLEPDILLRKSQVVSKGISAWTMLFVITLGVLSGALTSVAVWHCRTPKVKNQDVFVPLEGSRV